MKRPDLNTLIQNETHQNPGLIQSVIENINDPFEVDLETRQRVFEEVIVSKMKKLWKFMKGQNTQVKSL